MTIEQDFLLSSYFDGEADSDQKRRAETAVASDPAAAETLRSLASIRDLVAALSRPHAPDVSALVLDRIVADAGRWSPWKTWGPYVGRGLAASAIAASLGLIVFVGEESRSRGPSAPPPARVWETFETLAAQPPARAAVPPLAEAGEPETADSVPTIPAVQAPVVAEAEQPTPDRDQPAGFQELWATVGARRDFVVTSVPDESTTTTVETLLGQSTHRDFYKIVIPDDVARENSSATVAFAARLDPSEYTTLRGRLGSKFPDRVAIGDSEPEVAALLADVGRVSAAPATPAAEVSFPLTQHAFRVHSNASSTHRSEVDAATQRPDAPPLLPCPPIPPTRPLS